MNSMWMICAELILGQESKPKALGQALVDAKRNKGFIEPASARGSYKLTHHGEDFVRFELPRKGGSGE